MTPTIAPPALRLVRLPGEYGPVLRCFGELSVATSEALRRELMLLMTMGHPVLTVNISSCSYVDVDGILTILQTCKELRRRGSRLVIVAGAERTARLMQFMGIERVIPVFPTEELAARALRGEAPPAVPESWSAARGDAVVRWRALLQALADLSPEEALRQLTSITTLCERAEELFEELPTADASRCHFCPLFYALGGRPEDVGCRSVLDPMIAAICAGDEASVRAQVAHLIATLEQMPLPEEVSACAKRQPSRDGDPMSAAQHGGV
jgi:anti-anti-sigma factor